MSGNTMEEMSRHRVTAIFLEEAASSNRAPLAAAAPLLAQKVALVEKLAMHELSVTHPKIEAFVQGIPKNLIVPFAELDAKLIDLVWRTRRITSMFLLNALTRFGGVHNGDKFDDVLSRFQKHSVPAAALQRLIDDALLWPSLTTHPTNPTSLAYTKKGVAVDSLLADVSTTEEKLRPAIRDLINAPLDEEDLHGVRRKTPASEGEELLVFLERIYRAAPDSVFELRASLRKHGYGSAVNVKRLIDLHVWGPGDGDGNPNTTAEALTEFLQRKQSLLFALYADDLSRLPRNPRTQALRDALVAGELAAIRAAFEDLRREVGEHADSEIDALLIRYDTFGTHFAGVDVRHNSRDIMITVARLLELTDGIAMDEFTALSAELQTSVIRSRLLDPSIRLRAREMASAPLSLCKDGSKDCDVAKRVFARMRVVAQHPECFSKFIIAETTSIANVLGALLLLHCAGVPVMREGSPIDVVPLFESRQDLRQSPMMVHQLLTDPAFGENVRHRGYLLAMIAKSDTARLSGPGVQGAQEETMGQLLAMNPKNYDGKRVFVMLGGGDDQMRGGGRVVESPHVVLRAEAREGGKSPIRLAMTVQGMQLQLLFSCRLLVNYFVEGISAHLILSNARIQGLIPWRDPHPMVNEVAAARQTHLFFTKAMDRYEQLIGSDSKRDAVRRSLVDYLNAFPGEIIEWTNKSSRPGARTKTVDPFQGRAISLDQRAKHDGAYLTATIGVHDAMLVLATQLRCANAREQELSMEAHRHAYAGNKSFRDFVRMQATVLYQKDYEFAWSLRGGSPTYLERRQLEAAYIAGGYNPPRVLLAKLEAADQQLSFLLVVAITGKHPSGLSDLKDPLRAGWPDLAAALDSRERLSIVAKRLQLKAARRINNTKSTAVSSGDTDATLPHRDLAYFAYVGTNPTLSSPNFSLTLTDPFKEDGLPLLTESNPKIIGKVPMPVWVVPPPSAKL